MIIEVGGKRLAFGLQWKPHLSGGDLHKEARAAKSPYFWSAENSAYYGLLPEAGTKQKLKSPMYAGAIALLHRYSDFQNFVVVLAVPEPGPQLPQGGFVLCGIHRSRPHSDFDKVVETREEVLALLKAFQHLCGPESFKLLGDVTISGIESIGRDDLAKGADHGAALRKTKNALVNPLFGLTVLAVVVVGGTYGYSSYKAFKRAEAQRLAAASQKNAQQLYDEELAVRRKDFVLRARDVGSALAMVRSSDLNVGGWAVEKSTCNLMPEKQMVCTFEYKLRPQSKGTYETFVKAAVDLQNLEFNGERIKGARTVKDLPFVEQSLVMDAGKPQQDELIEFASALQRIRHLGEPKLGSFEPFAIPPGANVAELTSQPISASTWGFTGPMRNAKRFVDFPEYATLTQVTVTFSDQPRYEEKQSIAMMTLHGKIISKPNSPDKR